MRLPIIVSAILPLIVAPESDDWFGAVVGITTWLVFGVDYVVHVRHLEHYGRTGFGRFDLFVVIATAPWFLLPGAQAGGFVLLLRLAGLARLAMVSKGSRRLFDRLGGSPSWQAGSSSPVPWSPTTPSTPPTPSSPRSATRCGGASSPSPPSATGTSSPRPRPGARAVTIMVSGVAVVGLLAGSLASFFGWMGAKPLLGHQPASRKHRGHVQRRCARGPGHRGVAPSPSAGGPDRAVDGALLT